MVIPVGTDSQVCLSYIYLCQYEKENCCGTLVLESCDLFGFRLCPLLNSSLRFLTLPVRTLQELMIVDKLLDGTVKKTNELGVRYVPLI